jgi:large conductance mechanosensitive channel
MAVIYFAIVVAYKHIQTRRGHVVFGDPAPTKTCPFCLSDDLPVAAAKCKVLRHRPARHHTRHL